MSEMPTKKYELNTQSFHDGRVVLYQRPNLKKPVWQARIKIPNAAGYLIKSTGTTDFFEARRWSENLYDDIRLKQMNGVSVKTKTIEALWKLFEQSYPQEAPSQRRVKDVFHFVKAYALPYFGKTKIDEINTVAVNNFFDWRKANGRSKKSPTNTTLLSEISSLKAFLDWCYRRGFCSRKIEIDKPTPEGNRRPHFDARDYTKLTRFLREWVKQGKTATGGGKYRDRVMLTNYVLILANTGIRVGEARGLRWGDIDTDKAAEPESKEYIILQVKGKTGAREVVARTNEVKKYFQRIWQLRLNEKNGIKPALDEFVFCHRDGSQIYSFKKGFQNLLQNAGVEYDSTEQKRTIYSLRHTYATFRLQEGVHHFTLARNMGTSTRMLETFYGHTSNRAMADELTKTRKRAIKTLPWE